MILEAKSYGRAEEQPRVVFAECIVRIPDGNVSNGTTGTNTVNKGAGLKFHFPWKFCIIWKSHLIFGFTEIAGKDTNSNEDNKAHIRASSVPRPRAVLSSPGNSSLLFSALLRDEGVLSDKFLSA